MKKIVWILLAAVLLFTGCAAKESTKHEETAVMQQEPVYVAPKVGDYDSADTAVVVHIDEEEKKITFLNLVRGRRYTLWYDGATKILSKYEKGMSMAQLEEGTIVDVTFVKSNKRLNSIQISPSAWEEENVSQFEISNKSGDFVIASGQYNITDDLIIISNGEVVEMMDLSAQDIVTVRGIEHNIHSIVIDKGHGYLRLQNDEYFIGGWIEVGKTLIQPVTDDMLLTVPEGKYEVLITNGGNGGTKQIAVARDEEIELDVGDLKGEEIKKGSILFAVTPSTAQVYVDGDRVDISQKVEMEYGIHQLIVRAEGYDTITQYIKVGQAYASLEIELEKSEEIEEEDEDEEDEEEDDKSDYAYGTLDNNTSSNNSGGSNHSSSNNSNSNGSGNTSSSGGQNQNTTSGNHTTSGNDASTGNNGGSNGNNVTDTTGTYKIKIETPEGAEVYFDGNYVGIAPVSFKKTSGTHEITLRKSGYKTRSYTIRIDDEDKDVTWSFSDLVKESEE